VEGKRDLDLELLRRLIALIARKAVMAVGRPTPQDCKYTSRTKVTWYGGWLSRIRATESQE
jgi:hypothetical protein